MNRPARRPTPPTDRRRIAVIASLIVLGAVIIVAVALGSRVPKTASTAPFSASLAVGQKAPEFAVSTTGGPFSLAAAGGKPTLLEVFATWCPHCQREVPVLNDLYVTYRDRVNVVAVAGSPYGMDQSAPESQADVVAFVDQFKVQYPVAFDPTLDVAHKYLGTGFPTVVLIGSDGTVLAMRDGEIPRADLAKALDATLAGRKPDPKMGEKA
jgi:cytochrome c biogenesis protein CcmG/thiol:disulfide interchange protein DsbE